MIDHLLRLEPPLGSARVNVPHGRGRYNVLNNDIKMKAHSFASRPSAWQCPE